MCKNIIVVAPCISMAKTDQWVTINYRHSFNQLEVMSTKGNLPSFTINWGID